MYHLPRAHRHLLNHFWSSILWVHCTWIKCLSKWWSQTELVSLEQRWFIPKISLTFPRVWRCGDHRQIHTLLRSYHQIQLTTSIWLPASSINPVSSYFCHYHYKIGESDASELLFFVYQSAISSVYHHKWPDSQCLLEHQPFCVLSAHGVCGQAGCLSGK